MITLSGFYCNLNLQCIREQSSLVNLNVFFCIKSKKCPSLQRSIVLYRPCFKKSKTSIETSLPIIVLDRYCLLVRYLFIFDSFGASQAFYRNLWYLKVPSIEDYLFALELICCFCTGSQKKQHFDCPI